MNHFINTAEVEPTRARTPTLISTTPQPFPVLFFGDIRSHAFFFHANGAIESWSGNPAYTLRVTLGESEAGPFGGNYTVSCGSTSPALPHSTSAADLQAALNGLTTIQSEGDVSVAGAFPTFLVTANAVGVRTNISADAALLVPNAAITIEILTTGSVSVRQEWRISLRRNVIATDDTWTAITSPQNGWSGSLTTNTEGAFALLLNQGQVVAGLLEAQSLVTVEVLDLSGNPVSYFQIPFTLRAKPGDLGATAATPMASYQPLNATLSAIAASNDLSGVTVDGTNAPGFRNEPQVSKSADYVAVLSDSGKQIYHPPADASARTFTIPANALVAYPVGTKINFVNDVSAGVVTIAINSDTLVLFPGGSTGSRTLAAGNEATAKKVGSTRWIISGTSGLT